MKVIVFLLCIVIQIYAKPISIPKGASAKWVSNYLKQEGIITYASHFYAYIKLKKLESKLHSGEFNIQEKSSYADITKILTGKVNQYVSVTVPEGFTLNEISKTLESHQVIHSAKQFLIYVRENAEDILDKYPELSEIPTSNMEGVLFPDTYYFSKKSSYRVVFNTLIKRFNDVIVDLYKKEENPKLSLYNTLILASIIEKEAATQFEMPIISGVFHNRLNKNMFLASCPTVGYAMGKPRKKTLSYKDLEFRSPYNTYRHRGLPPAPIASPGERAFLAALNPKKTSYYYFVAKNNGSGTHVFSKTLNEHLKNQKKIMTETH